jgi:hypothetical protein
MSRERVFEITAEIRSLIEEQEALLTTGASFFEISAEDIAACAERHARIGKLSGELKKLHLLSSFTDPKAESIN